MKRITKILGLLLVGFAFIACSSNVVKTENGYFANKEYQPTGMSTIVGQTADYDGENANRWVVVPEAYFGFYYTDNIDSFTNNEQLLLQFPSQYMVLLGYAEKAGIDYANSVDWESWQSLPPEEIQSKIDEYSMAMAEYVNPVLSIFVLDINDETSLANFIEFKTIFGADVQPVTSFNEKELYIGFKPNKKEGLDEVSSQIHDAIVADYEAFKSNVLLYSPLVADPATTERSPARAREAFLSEFTTTDSNGNEVTQEIFANYDITMVNVWATFCPPCIHEMPDLQELYSSLPSNINMITICTDYEGNEDLAKQIVSDVNGTFPILLRSSSLDSNFLHSVQAIPTTVFVNNKGQIVGNYQVGAPTSEGSIADSYMALINTALGIIQK